MLDSYFSLAADFWRNFGSEIQYPYLGIKMYTENATTDVYCKCIYFSFSEKYFPLKRNKSFFSPPNLEIYSTK